jgi:hypothetical protein
MRMRSELKDSKAKVEMLEKEVMDGMIRGMVKTKMAEADAKVKETAAKAMEADKKALLKISDWRLELVEAGVELADSRAELIEASQREQELQGVAKDLQARLSSAGSRLHSKPLSLFISAPHIVSSRPSLQQNESSDDLDHCYTVQHGSNGPSVKTSEQTMTRIFILSPTQGFYCIIFTCIVHIVYVFITVKSPYRSLLHHTPKTVNNTVFTR